MDLNLETLKREMVAYLAASEFAVFYSDPGGLKGMPLVLWDVDRYPDYQMFLDVARKAGVKIVMFGAAEFDAADLDEMEEQLEEGEFTPIGALEPSRSNARILSASNHGLRRLVRPRRAAPGRPRGRVRLPAHRLRVRPAPPRLVALLGGRA